MPVRPRRQRRHRLALSPQRIIDLVIGPRPFVGEPDDVLRALYREHAQREGADHSWWAWWRFEPHVPEALRGERPKLYPVEDGERVRRERADLEARRAAWLAEKNGASGATKQT